MHGACDSCPLVLEGENQVANNPAVHSPHLTLILPARARRLLARTNTGMMYSIPAILERPVSCELHVQNLHTILAIVLFFVSEPYCFGTGCETMLGWPC
jgi:hypothetical protein